MDVALFLPGFEFLFLSFVLLGRGVGHLPFESRGVRLFPRILLEGLLATSTDSATTITMFAWRSLLHGPLHPSASALSLLAGRPWLLVLVFDRALDADLPLAQLGGVQLQSQLHSIRVLDRNITTEDRFLKEGNLQYQGLLYLRLLI